MDFKYVCNFYYLNFNFFFLFYFIVVQAAVVEFARAYVDKNANTEEITEKDEDHFIVFMPEIDRYMMGGNMRLGARTT